MFLAIGKFSVCIVGKYTPRTYHPRVVIATREVERPENLMRVMEEDQSVSRAFEAKCEDLLADVSE